LIEAPNIYGAQLPSQLLDDLKIVHRNCEHLSGMINDVLDLSQTEAGRLTLRRTTGDVREDILHAVEIVRPLAEKKGVALAVEIPNSPAFCSRDQTRLRQVLLNLLSNAARYTAKGSITVRLLLQPCQMRIEVADTGPGIEAADLDRIFEPFFQSGHLEGLAQKGSGLGLSISKQFVEMHGGKMGVASVRHAGSTFWLSIPTHPADEPVAKADRWIHSEWAWHERQNRVELPVAPRQRRVILLDTVDGIHPFLDEQSDQVEVVCQETIADVVTATTATPAHGVIVNGSSAESILPVMAELCRQVPDTPVLGWAMPTPTHRARAAGAMDYLVKPVTRADLVAILETLPRIQRVLIVDDDGEVQRLLTRFLYTYDETIRVATATDVESALHLLCAFSPDLMLLDLTLEHGTGWELLARKQELPDLAAIPAVILSAQDPVDQPFHSPFLVASIGQGLPLTSLSHGSLALMDLLLSAPSELDPAFE
jgi:CheY-like chemotaxis protein